MLMNAPPRHVSERFETFVCRPWIVQFDMTNNEHCNIWEVFGAADSWDQPVRRAETPLTGYVPSQGSFLQRSNVIGQNFDFSQSIGNTHSTPSHQNQSVYPTDVASKNWHENFHLPRSDDQAMLFDNEAHWTTNNGIWTGSAQFQEPTDFSKVFPQQHLDQANYLGAHSTTAIGGTQFSSGNQTSTADGFSDWAASVSSPQIPYIPSLNSYTHDGLPRIVQTSPWTANSDLSSEWMQATAVPMTISPKALISKSSAAMSSSGSSQGSEVALSAEESPLLPISTFETEQAINSIIPRPEYHETKFIIPNSGPILPTNTLANDNTTVKPSRTILPKIREISKDHKTQTTSGLTQNKTPQRSAKRIDSKLVSSVQATDSDIDSDRTTSASSKTAKEKTIHRRESKDAFLVRSKLAGMSYKDIRREGGFTEAESTLRGRYRTLTKDKTERVRKPEWEDNDIRLLKKAVRKYTRKISSGSGKLKVPWKQVADYIYDKGGSYHFGNATCRKKYDELMARSPR